MKRRNAPRRGRKRHVFGRAAMFVLCLVFSLLFLLLFFLGLFFFFLLLLLFGFERSILGAGRPQRHGAKE